MRDKRAKSEKKIWIVLVIALVGLLAGAYIIWNVTRDDREGSVNYSALRSLTKAGAIPDETVLPQVEIPDLNIDFEALKEINADCIAWLYSPDTPIDYPVLGAEDYEQYLYVLPTGKKNKNGSLFLDYHCKRDFSDRMSIIYGHNMRSGAMFGSLKSYHEQEYFDEHPYIYLYTPERNYRIDVAYGFLIKATTWRDNGYMHQENADAILEAAEKATTFQSPITIGEGDRFALLSTCDTKDRSSRYLLIGKLVPEYADISTQ